MILAANSPSPSRKPIAKRHHFPSRWRIAGLLAFAAMPLTFGILRLLQLAGLSDAMPPALVSPVPLVLHIVGALLYATLGALQFSTPLRRRWPSWHRASGRVALVGALLVALSALWLSALYVTPSPGGLLLVGFRVAVAIGMLISIALGVGAIVRGDIPHHRAWMIRSYALGLGAATQMLVLLAADIATGGPPTDLQRALLMGLAWGVNIAWAEAAIRRARPTRPVRATHEQR